MKISSSAALRISLLSLLVLFCGPNSGISMAQDDPGQLLKWYLETGSYEFSDKIRDEYPGSEYEVFCDAWDRVGANDEQARKLALKLSQDYPGFAPGHFVLGTVLVVGFKEYSAALAHFDRSLELDQDLCGPI